MEPETSSGSGDHEPTALAPTTRVHPDPHVLAKRVDEEIVLVHLETNRIYELNGTGASLWDGLAQGSTQAELEQRLALEYDVDPGELTREVDELLGQLLSEHLIRTS